MRMGKRKWCLLAAWLLMGLVGLAIGSAALPSIVPAGNLVNAQSTRTVDGNPSDWIGTPGADNSWVVSNGEGIWRDAASDDTGNGSYIYPNCTHTSPAIPDSKGWEGYAYAYTGYPGGGRRGGGMVDLREFRVTRDISNLYILLRFENMGSQAIAVEWNQGAHTAGSGANDTNFGKILAQVYIDTDRVSGSGRTDAAMLGNFEFDAACAWEVCIDVAGDVCRGYPRVELADGTIYYHNVSSDCYANCDIYSAIEMKVPYSEIGDPTGKTWRFMVVVGGFDEGRWRPVWDTEMAKLMGWPPMFRFIGGEGMDPPPGEPGNDPNIIDMAFTASKAEQEALLNSFTKLPGTGVVVINKYQDINMDTVPWIPIYSLPILLIIMTAILYVRKKKLSRFVEHQ